MLLWTHALIQKYLQPVPIFHALLCFKCIAVKKVGRNPSPNGDYVVMAVDTHWKKKKQKQKQVKHIAYWIAREMKEKNKAEK